MRVDAAPPPPPEQIAAAIQASLVDAQRHPESLADFAPLARIGAMVGGIVLESMKGPGIADALVEMLPNIFGEIADSISELANINPVFALVLGFIIDNGGAADEQNLQADVEWCRREALTVESTGSGGATRAVDLFMRDHPKFGLVRPDVGALLVYVTEDPDKLNFKLRHRDAKLGVPDAERAKFKHWRELVDGCYRQLDGGAAIYPLWLDLLRQQYDRGHITTSSLRAQHFYRDLRLMNQSGPHAKGWARDWAITAAYIKGKDSLPPNGNEDRPCCARFDPRSREQVAEILRVWRNTAFPSYSDDKEHMAMVETQAVDLARRLVNPGALHLPVPGAIRLTPKAPPAPHKHGTKPGGPSGVHHFTTDEDDADPHNDPEPGPVGASPMPSKDGGSVVLWMGPVSASNLLGAIPDGWRLVTINRGANDGIKSSDFAALSLQDDAIAQFAGPKTARVFLAAWSAGGALLDRMLVKHASDPRVLGVICADALYLATGTLATLPQHEGVHTALLPSSSLPFSASASNVNGPGYDSSAQSWARALDAWFPGDVHNTDEPDGRTTTLAHAPHFSLMEFGKYGHTQHATIAAPILLRTMAMDLGETYGDGRSLAEFAEATRAKKSPGARSDGSKPSTPSKPAPSTPTAKPANNSGGGLALAAVAVGALLLLDGK